MPGKMRSPSESNLAGWIMAALILAALVFGSRSCHFTELRF
jgi:hypothetical protein